MNDTRISTFLMFTGQAGEAIRFYTSLIEDSEVRSMKLYGSEGPGAEGTVFHAVFTLAGVEFMAIDSPVKHGFGFTPAISLYVTCAEEAQVERYFHALAQGGSVMMPLGTYPFSRKFGWLQDRFGVSWQISVK